MGEKLKSVKAKMKTLFAIGLVILAAHGAPVEQELDSAWENFKHRFGRQYLSASEHDSRKAVFAVNLEYINKHNSEYALGLHSYTLGINAFADLTNKEFVKKYNRYISPAIHEQVEVEADIDVASLPESVDWRTEGYVTPVKNQGQCGSCWAFSAIVTMEGAHFKKSGQLVSLSEQNLVDCVKYNSAGCNGGFPIDGIHYAIKNGGVDTESAYKYHARNGHCHFKKDHVGATFTSAKRVAHKNETALQSALATIGPISVAIDASRWSFQLYKGGVYNEPHCSTTSLDHGVAAVGYGTEDGKDYYIVKNSWGKSWGEDGYIKMSRNHKNQCGIATDACYAIA